MNTKDKLSYERLISRAEYYKEKSLDLEKKLVFAEETIEKLEEEIKNNPHLADLAAKERELEKVTSELEDTKYKLKRSQNEELENRIAGYEELLRKIQIELNEKDQQIDLYQQRVKSMEKRMSLNHRMEPVFGNPQDEADQGPAVKKEGYGCLSLFDYSFILTDEKAGFVKGSFLIENTGTEYLENPYICFRFHPAEASAIKGKILSYVSNTTQQETSQLQWMYMDNDWANDAKNRGEIWICPIRETRLHAGENVSLTDFQIPIKKQIDENIRVEAFVYFHKQNYKIKAANHISINF